MLMLLGATSLSGQQHEADKAWTEGRYETARIGYERVLQEDPNAARANLRLGILLSWKGKLDSSLVLIGRARIADPHDSEMRLAHARVHSWNKQYDVALALYDSMLTEQPGHRDAELARSQTLSWAGRLEEADSTYRVLIEKDPADRDARLGQAQVRAWRGKLEAAEQAYRAILERNPQDADASAGLAYVYYWQGDLAQARREAETALAVDSLHRGARELRHTLTEANRPAVEATAAWSNDSDRNTSFWQTLGSSAVIAKGLSAFGSVNALETSDPSRDATRVGAEAGLSLALGRVTLSGAAGARRIVPEVADPRTSATYRARLGYRPVSALGFNAGYSRSPFDEIAALMERALDLELLEAGFDARPFTGSSIYAAGSELWLSDGNNRTGVLAGITQKLGRRLSVGLFGRTLSFERRGTGYFSPDRFSVLEATASYHVDTRTWGGSLGGGLGGQQVGKGGAAQTEWHLEGRVGRRWGIGNRIELFGLITNSAVSSTSGAFRYRSAGLTLRLGL
ncbi:MAG: tetratricopeptide repeat protein [Gemmatimonadales bacterium]|nr:tetratricopeptide repeat protein [Gemmatimonadales bacterium]